MGYDAERAVEGYWAMPFENPTMSELMRDIRTAQDTRRRHLEQREKDKWLFRAFEAEHGSPVEPDFKTQGTTTGRYTSAEPLSEEIPKGKNMSRKDAILSRMRALEAELAELEKLPAEPRPTNGPTIIHFVKQFWWYGKEERKQPAPKEYSYAFIKNPHDGCWSGTGPKAPKSYTWDELVHWLNTTGPFPIIYVIDGMHEYYVPKEEDDS
jgi:hypothetical protein